MTTFHAIILAIVEGLTEFLPVSSTGHMIIASSMMGINQDAFTKDFTVIVQFGAILSVLVLYWRRFISSVAFYKKLVVGVLPVLAIGFVVKDVVDELLGSVTVVALALIIGGILLIFVDRWFARQEERLQSSNEGTIDKMTYPQAAAIGAIQCLAIIPGVSRSASSIIGGLSLKLTRQAAAEFSFFLAVPTMAAATGYKLLKMFMNGASFTSDHVLALVIGNIVAFIVAMIAIKAFIGFLTRRGFFVFGIYRIIVGAILLALIYSGHSIQVM